MTKARGTTRIPALVFGSIGLLILIWGVVLALQAFLVMQSWGRTDAEITRSAMVAVKDRYQADIAIRFYVDRREYDLPVSNRTMSGGYAWVQSRLDEFPVGARREVRFDRADPSRVRINVGPNFDTFGLPVILVVLGLLFSGIGLLAYRSAVWQEEASRKVDPRQATIAAKRVVLGASVFVLLIGLAFLAASVWMAMTSIRESHWPTIQAFVERSEIVRSSSSSRSHGPLYVGRVHVRYMVGDRLFHVPIDTRFQTSRRRSIEKAIAEFPQGTWQQFRMNPGNASDLRFTSSSILLPSVFALVGLVATGVAILLLRKSMRD
ncbi:MAG TPA: DUF3592 domain-containing protein [Thermoanaerobaculia bacterium]|nr:DUF3592 domain-containing protein [Thermoanaerobaculia bacterium]